MSANFVIFEGVVGAQGSSSSSLWYSVTGVLAFPKGFPRVDLSIRCSRWKASGFGEALMLLHPATPIRHGRSVGFPNRIRRREDSFISRFLYLDPNDLCSGAVIILAFYARYTTLWGHYSIRIRQSLTWPNPFTNTPDMSLVLDSRHGLGLADWVYLCRRYSRLDEGDQSILPLRWYPLLGHIYRSRSGMASCRLVRFRIWKHQKSACLEVIPGLPHKINLNKRASCPGFLSRGQPS